MATNNNGQVYNNPNQYSQTAQTIDVATVMGYAGKAEYNGNPVSWAQYIMKMTQDIYVQNSYSESWTRKFATKEVSTRGTRQYTFTPAAIPVSNYAQTDLGNRTFATAMQVYGMPILFLQTNFWTNEFITLTSEEFSDGIQKGLINSLKKSIPMVKNGLSLLENTMFCLASGQFFFVDFMGRKVTTSPRNPNALNQNSFHILWGTQSPQLDLNTGGVNIGIDTELLRDEAYNISTFLMKFEMAITPFAIGYDPKKLHVDCSLYMRANMARVLEIGFPSSFEKEMINKSSYDDAEISRWFNLVLTNYGTTPYLQNPAYGRMVSKEVAPSAGNAGSPLGYGINNVCDMSYLGNVVAILSSEDSIETYITPYIAFNPYTNSKTFYRLGGAWGWGQVHTPIWSYSDWTFLDSSAYITFNGVTKKASAGNGNTDWVVTQTNASTQGDADPEFSATKTLNGITWTITYTINLNQLLDDMTQAQAVEMAWEPSMGYDVFNFPKLPTSINDPIDNCDVQVFSGADGNSATAMTFAEWAKTRSIGSFDQPLLLGNGKVSSVIDEIQIGGDQLRYAMGELKVAYPEDTPVVA